MTGITRRLASAHTLLFRVAVAVTVVFVGGLTAVAVTDVQLQPVLSSSMTPTVPRYSLVLAVPVRGDQLRVGDVAVFQPPAGYLPAEQQLVMHRVVDLHHQGGRAVMRTRGDANPAADPWTVDLTQSAVYRVRTVVPHAGIAWQFLPNPTRHTGGLLTWPGLMLLIGVTGIAIRTRRRTRVPAPQHEARTVALREASYELRAPLSSIVGYTELLADAELDPAHAQIVETITRQARRLTDFADDLSARTA